MKGFGTTSIRVLLLLLVCMQSAAFAQNKYPHDDIAKRDAMISQWDQQASLQSALEIMVIVFGAAITVVQGFQKGWCKPATIAMGAFTSVFSAVNTKVFPVDRRELRAAVVEGNRLATKLHRRARALDEASAAEAKAALGVELEETLGKFDDLAVKVSGADVGTGSGAEKKASLFFTSVYAMAGEDSCGLPAKSDPLRWYFVGKSRDTSVTHAKEQSQSDAVDRAVTELTPKGLDRKAVREMLDKLAVVDDTAYTVDKKEGQYTYCTQIRINKTAMNLLKTAPPENMPSKAPPQKAASPLRIEPGHSIRLAGNPPLYLYLRKVQNHGSDPSVAEVFILESAGQEWVNPALNGPAFKAAIAKLTEASGEQLAGERYLYHEVKKNDTVKMKLSSGRNVTINFTDVKYVMNRVDFTVTAD